MLTTTYRDLIIHYQNEDELRTLVDEIFKQRTYYVELESQTPLIIDVGAHIGLVTLYYHQLYPNARFICVEPNPESAKLLKMNLEENLVSDYIIIQKAVSAREGVTTLFTHEKWSLLSSVYEGGWSGDEQMQPIQVPTILLSSLLDQDIDLLKIDIEGAELEVLQEAKSFLSVVQHLMIEFHKTKTRSESSLLKILQQKYKNVETSLDPRSEKNKWNKLLMIEAKRK